MQMKIEIYFDEFMPAGEREQFLNDLNKCNDGEEVSDVFYRYHGLFDVDPTRVYIFSKEKRFKHHGSIEVY